MPPRRTNDVTYFARTTFRNQGTLFGIKRADRLSHIYIIGKTGTGKSTLLETMIRQDIENGKGCALVDPHGDLVERIAASVPEHRASDVVYLNAPDPSQPYGYNPLRYVVPERRSLAAAGVLEVFKKIWDDSWGTRMEHILRNALLLLFDQRHATLSDILRLLVDDDYRRTCARVTDNERVRAFWLKEFEHYSYRLRAEAIVPIQNKVGAFLADPMLNRILTHPEKDIRIRRIMDNRGILLVNLARGRIGEDAAMILGGLLVTMIGLAAFSRADMPEEDRRPFYLYLDEFQNFTTLSIATMTAELRKYGVGLILAHQYLSQLAPEVRDAVLGNAGTLISFRLGAVDALFVAREFAPTFDTTDLLTLPNFHIYLKLMIDGAPSQPFSARSIRDQNTP